MKNKKWLALLLAAVLILCLLPASALADDKDGTPKEITNDKGNTLFNEGDIVFNNEGIVFNNSGIVYNNGGTVYNNGGKVFNNAGVVYNNGGSVYNNDGTVYKNEGEVITNGGTVADDGSDGNFRVDMAADYSAFAAFEGLKEDEKGEGLVMDEDGVCTIIPNDGFSIAAASASAGELTDNEDGTYTLSKLDKSALLTLSFKPAAPVFSVESGTFGSSFKLEMSAAEGAAIYYTLDGSEPTEESTLYKEPLTVEESMAVSAVAVVNEAEKSNIATAAYALPVLTTPVFDTEDEGYKQPKEQGVKVENLGPVDAVITGIAMDGESAESFILNTTEGGTVPAGETDDSTWTIRPAKDLAQGAYSARITVTFDSGDSTVLFVSFKVK